MEGLCLVIAQHLNGNGQFSEEIGSPPISMRLVRL